MHRWLPAAVAAAGLALYVATLAPTVLWGDDAELQRIVLSGEARTIGQSSSASHVLWLAITRAFVPWTSWLPLDTAGRTNLVSAIAAAIALPFVCAAGAELATGIVRRPWLAGAAAAAALGLSHTFWMLAVRPDAYTLQTALLAIATWGVLRWRRSGTAVGPLLASGLAVAAGLTNHAMILASLPGLGWMALTVPPRARRAALAALAAAGLVAVVALVVAGAWGAPLLDLLRTIQTYRPRLPGARDALLMPAYLLYQFPLSLPLAAFGAHRIWQLTRTLLAGLAFIYLGNVALILGLNVRDQFIFFLPSYLPVALLVGLGCAAAADGLASLRDRFAANRRWRSRARLAGPALAAALLAPLAVYPVAAVAASDLATRLALARRLPGRDPVSYYLYPGKTGYLGARAYGEAALASLPPDAAVVADWLPYQTLRYLQVVGGIREDVLLSQLNAGGQTQLRFLLEHRNRRPLYLADNAPFPYYEIDEITRCFQVTLEGVLYRLTPRTDAADPGLCR